MFSLKKIFAAALSSVMLVSALPSISFAADSSDHILADWKFSASNATGSISSGKMTLSDVSGNGNDLEMRTWGLLGKTTASFSDESLFGDEGSLFFNGNTISGGIDFVTVADAPINKETFPDGYTIEILYKMPDDWTQNDRWTNLMSRLGSTDAIDPDDADNTSVTTAIHVSNCKEIQFIPVNKDNKSTLSSNVWSIAMDKAENWYSIVITYDNNTFSTYINGATSFRNITNKSDMQGLYADPDDGRFVIGSRIKSGRPDKYTRGYIQEIRISDKALSKDEWLVPNPEAYLGEYGDNSPFEETAPDRYNFVFLPDVQNAVEFKDDILDIASNWIVENKDYANIAGVIGLGDNVNNFWVTQEWENVERSMSIMAKGGVKTLIQPGNHDSGNGQNYWYFEKYFGKNSNFQKLVSDYVECSSPSGTGFVMDAPAGSFDYKIITIDKYKVSDASETAWLRNQLTKYQTSPVIIVSHDILDCSATSPNDVKLSSVGSNIWDIVKDYDNVFLMVAGHNHGYGNLKLTNSYGHDVYSVLADYQFSYNGGNALFKFAEFDEAGNKIRISTFSPYVATLDEEDKTFFDVNFMTGKGHYDELDLNFEERLGSLQIYSQGENLISNPSFEEGTSGWTANNAGTIKELSSQGWVVSDEYAHDGKYSLKQVSSKGSASDENLCTFIPIEAGKKYSLSYWEYSTVTNTSGWSRMSACAVTNGNGALGSGLEIMDCGGFSSWQSGSPRDLSYYEGWTNRTYEFDTTNTPDAKYIMIAYAWGDAGTFYIDDFSLTEVSLDTYTRTVIKSVSATNNGDSVDLSVDFESGANTDASLIAAGYDENGVVVSISYVKDGEATLKGEGIKNVQVFCWKGLSNLTPLTKAKTVTVE